MPSIIALVAGEWCTGRFGTPCAGGWEGRMRPAQPRRRRPRGVGRNPASASAWARGVSYTPVPSARSTVRRPRAPPRTASASPAAAGTSTPGSLVQDSSVLPPRSTYSTRCPSDSTTSAPALRPGRCAPGTSPGRAGQGSAEPNALAGSAAASTVMGGPAFPAAPGPFSPWLLALAMPPPYPSPPYPVSPWLLSLPASPPYPPPPYPLSPWLPSLPAPPLYPLSPWLPSLPAPAPYPLSPGRPSAAAS